MKTLEPNAVLVAVLGPFLLSAAILQDPPPVEPNGKCCIPISFAQPSFDAGTPFGGCSGQTNLSNPVYLCAKQNEAGRVLGATCKVANPDDNCSESWTLMVAGVPTYDCQWEWSFIDGYYCTWVANGGTTTVSVSPACGPGDTTCN